MQMSLSWAARKGSLCCAVPHVQLIGHVSSVFHNAVNGNIAINIPSYIMTPMQLQGRSQRQFINWR